MMSMGQAIASVTQTIMSMDQAIASIIQTMMSMNQAIASITQTKISVNQAIASVTQTITSVAQTMLSMSQTMTFEGYFIKIKLKTSHLRFLFLTLRCSKTFSGLSYNLPSALFPKIPLTS